MNRTPDVLNSGQAYLRRRAEIVAGPSLRNSQRPPHLFPELRLTLLQQWLLRVRTGQVQ
jgi:hypothetical protein